MLNPGFVGGKQEKGGGLDRAEVFGLSVDYTLNLLRTPSTRIKAIRRGIFRHRHYLLLSRANCIRNR